MTVGIFGLGYVGCVGLGALAELGNYVIGVDINTTKVDLINNGKATIVEKGIDELIGTNLKLKEIIEKKSGKIAGQDFGVVSNPEFLREGSAVEDFFNPPYTILA